ncbi:ATP-binding protein [Bacteriovorax sp. Seq25_V]|uniref:ATP-binding protein n=1 Tax=Bacteriovorax sp. Seq25_V TaxID=1201288 RepID=UPI0009FDE9AF
MGTEEDKIANLFNPFNQADASITRKFGGTGLSLSISKEVTRLLNGSISVSSVFQKGSTFPIEIPIETVSTSTENEAIDFDEKTLAKEFPYNILIVEDNVVNQKLALLTLQ